MVKKETWKFKLPAINNGRLVSKTKFSRGQLAVFAVIFACIGGYLIYKSLAASLPVVYISQSQVGTADGSTCANAKAVSFFNTAANWGTGTTQIGPGTTVHLCGTITTDLTFQGSGTSGNPITLFFEPNAKLSQPVCGGCIGMNNRSFITIDGGTNGVLESNANGTAQANHSGMTAIDANPCNDCEIKNLTVGSLYTIAPGDTFICASGCAVDNAGVRCIDFAGNNWKIHDNTFHDASWCLFEHGDDSNTRIYNNNIYNFDHGWIPGSASSGKLYFYNNHIHDMGLWDACNSGANCHHDGIHCYNIPGPDHYVGVYIYNNRWDGTLGTSATGWIFLEANTGSSCADSTSAFYIFNNIFSSSDQVSTNDYVGGCSSICAPTYTYNNTFSGPGLGHYGSNQAGCGWGHDAFKNNVSGGCHRLVDSDAAGGATDYNAYASPDTGNCFPTFNCNFAQWQATGKDVHSVFALNGATGSNAIGAGTNLTSLCSGDLVPLCSDINGNARPTTGAWDAGAVKLTSVANLWISTTGNDSTCVRGDQSKPCLSFSKACSIAQGGDVVQVADGTYAGQDLSSCTGKTSTVTFTTIAGHECPYSAATPWNQLPAQSSDTSCSVKINGELGMSAAKTGTPANSPLKNLKFVGMYAGNLKTLWAHNITFSHMATADFQILASDSVSVLDSDIGNTFNGDCSIVAMQETAAGGSVAQPTNITIQRNIFHDSLRLNSTQGHPDGLFIYEMDGGLIDSNVMYRAGVIGIYMNLVEWAPLYGLGKINNVMVTNNVIHDIVDMTDTDGPTHSVAQNTLAPQTISLGDNDISNVTVAFNSVSGWIRRQDNTASGGSGTGTTTNLKIYANIADGIVYGGSYGCPISSSIDYNYLYSTNAVKCGTHDVKGAGTTPFTANDTWTPVGSYYTVTPGNFATKAGTAPIDMVPASFCTANPGVCPLVDFNNAIRPINTSYDAGAYELGGAGGGITDTIAPTISLSAPTAGSTVSGSVTVSANASDNVGVAGVQFKLDGNNLGSEDTSSPYSITWNATTASNGSHTLTATARDAASNTTTSSSITVTVTGGTNILIIGEPNVLSTGDSGNANLLLAQSTILSQSASVQSLSFYVTTAAGKLRLGIYDDTGPSGGPGALKAATAEITPTTGWNTAVTTTTPTLSPGTYWLAYLPSDNNLAFVKNTDTSSSGKYYTYTYGALPATFSTTTTSTASHWSFYATLNLGAPPAIPGDLNNDGHVTVIDLSILLSHYGVSGTPAQGDCNNDGIINILDLSILLSHYGT